jgi:hypothetical protein
MSGYGNREGSLRANASDWAGRVIEDATRDVQNNAAPLELITCSCSTGGSRNSPASPRD